MPTVLECGILSGHIYKPKQTHYLGHRIVSATLSTLPEIQPHTGWVLLSDAFHAEWFSEFFAGLYIKFLHGRPVDQVFAVRGTAKPEDFLVDIVSWSSDVNGDNQHDHMPWYVGQAIHASVAARRYVAKHFPELPFWGMCYTGHSLGGAIAKCLSLIHMRTHVCAFNAPGCGHLPGVDTERHAYLMNINAKYGFVNKVGETIGEIDLVDIPNHEAQAKAMFHAFWKEAYEAGKVSYKLSDVMPSQLEPAMDAAGATATLASFSPALDVSIQRCKTEADKTLWGRLNNLIGNPECHAKGLAHDGETIYAQHSIDHMVTTLQHEQYAEVAGTPVYQ